MTDIISHPTLTTYYIVYNEDKSVMHHGEIAPNQVLSSTLANVEQFTDAAAYQARCIALGIDLAADDPQGVPPQ